MPCNPTQLITVRTTLSAEDAIFQLDHFDNGLTTGSYAQTATFNAFIKSLYNLGVDTELFHALSYRFTASETADDGSFTPSGAFADITNPGRSISQATRVGGTNPRVSLTNVVPAPKSGGNTGTGTCNIVIANPLLTGWQEGVYTLTCTAAATNGGTFVLKDPSAVTLGTYSLPGTSGGSVTTASQIAVIVSDGATDFIVGDAFDIKVETGAPAFCNDDAACDTRFPSNYSANPTSRSYFFCGRISNIPLTQYLLKCDTPPSSPGSGDYIMLLYSGTSHSVRWYYDAATSVQWVIDPTVKANPDGVTMLFTFDQTNGHQLYVNGSLQSRTGTDVTTALTVTDFCYLGDETTYSSFARFKALNFMGYVATSLGLSTDAAVAARTALFALGDEMLGL